jgi:carbonic anhydrase-like protein
MAGDVVYESRLAWDPERPHTTLITCVDGRWFHHFQEFARVHLNAGDRTDFLAVPGGIEPLTLVDLLPKDFNFFRRRLEGLVEAHGTRRVVAIAHQDCAWYRTRRIGPRTIDVREKQISDLRVSARRLREMLDGVTVDTFFARLSGRSPERVVFDLVE